MNPEEIRKLLGGYATGTLTEAERKALFAAALDDQELFDELGREQSLKELLEVPGARSRLAAALAPPRGPEPVVKWWKKPLPWAMAGTLAAGIVVAFALLRQPRLEIANVQTQQSETRAKLDQPVAPPQAVSEPARRQVPAQNRPVTATEAKRFEASPPPVPEPAPPPPAPTIQSAQSLVAPRPAKTFDELSPQEALKKEESAKADSAPAARADKGLADEKDALPAAQPKAQAAQPALGGFVGREQAAANSVTQSPRPASLAALRSIARSGTVGDLTKSQFAFDYTLLHESVSVRPLAPGFLQVTAVGVGGRQLMLHPPSRMEAGTSVSIAIPSGSTTLTLEFTAQPPARDAVSSIANAEALTVRRAGKVSAEKAPVSKQEPVAPDSRLSITLAVP